MDDAMTPFLLMRAFRGLVDAVHADLATAGFPGIRAHHGFALQAIGTGCIGVQLGERLGVSKQAATKTADGLHGLGLIERQVNPADRRERLLVLTARGQEVLRRSGIAFRDQVARWRQEQGDTAVATTLATLAAVSAGTRDDTDLSDWVV